ncbi:hypothetical protein COP1_023764 [Malus domestica]
MRFRLENLKGKPIRKQERICHAEAVLKSKKTKHREPLIFYFRYTIDAPFNESPAASSWRTNTGFLKRKSGEFTCRPCKSCSCLSTLHYTSNTQSWLQNTFDINLSFIVSPLLAWVPDNVMRSITESLVATVMDDVKLDAVLLADYDKFKTEKLKTEV